MGRVEDLVSRYQSHIGTPWQRNLAGAQKAIFVVYPKTDERRLRARLELFDMATTKTGHDWRLLDLTDAFARWMAEMPYRGEYFENPVDLRMRLRGDFVHFAAAELRRELVAPDVTADTVVAVHGVAALYGLTKLSLVLKEVEQDIKGRLVVFFPGEFENNNYRLLDARDGWNYLAVPITLHGGAIE
ncbi:MAG: DUF1788 domain-containing protein [Phycisphaerae bacterium]